MNTLQQNLILRELSLLKTHPTAEELFYIVKRFLPNIGLATIYRNLEKFCKDGIVRKIAGKIDRYDGDVTCHNHIRCIKCGKVEDFISDIKLNKKTVEKMGYKLDGFKIELKGTCSSCRKKELG